MDQKSQTNFNSLDILRYWNSNFSILLVHTFIEVSFESRLLEEEEILLGIMKCASHNGIRERNSTKFAKVPLKKTFFDFLTTRSRKLQQCTPLDV